MSGEVQVFRCSRCSYRMWDANLEDVDAHWATVHAAGGKRGCPDPACLVLDPYHTSDHKVAPGHPVLRGQKRWP